MELVAVELAAVELVAVVRGPWSVVRGEPGGGGAGGGGAGGGEPGGWRIILSSNLQNQTFILSSVQKIGVLALL